MCWSSSRDFDLHRLVEDELLMEMPGGAAARSCPEPVQLSAADADFEAAEAARAESRSPCSARCVKASRQ